MKRVLLSAFTVVSLIISAFSPVLAADTPEIVWRGDYSDNSAPRLNVSFTVPGSYTRQITAVICPKDSAPSAENFVRIKEITANGGADGKISFGVSDSFDASRDYALLVNGNGYEQFSAEKDIFVLSPTEIQTLLPQFNSADSSGIGGLFTSKVKNALSLSGTADSELTGYVLQSRTRDFGGSFKTFNDVRTAWCAADVIVTLNRDGVTADEVKAKIESNAESLSIDMEADPNYDKYSDETFTLLLSYAKRYNNGNGVSSCLDVRNVIQKSLAVTVINKSAVDNKTDAEKDMLTNVKKYQSAIGIDNSYMTKFENLSSEQVKARVLRQLYGKNFTDTETILTAFKNAVDNPPSDGSDGGNGGGSGGGNGGGGGSQYNIAPGIEQKPQKEELQTAFSDVDSSHWAADYISALAAKGVVSGYEDGSFAPENVVTREEFVKMIISAAGLYDSQAECEFDDVGKNEWYYRFVASAVAGGIITGTDEHTFGTGAEIARQDVAVITARVLERFGKAESGAAESAQFGDYGEIEDYARESVEALSYMGILNGFEDLTFRPNESLSRAQAAKIIYMILEKI